MFAAPAWLRPAAIGCAAIVLVLLLGALWTLFSPGRLLTAGVVSLQRRVSRALPPSTPASERQRLELAFRCLTTAVDAGRVDEAGVAPVGAVCRDALADGTVSEAELRAIEEAVESACARLGGGSPR